MTETDPQLTHVVLFSMDGKKMASGRMSEADAERLVANRHEQGCEDAEAHLCPGVYYGCLHCWPEPGPAAGQSFLERDDLENHSRQTSGTASLRRRVVALKN